VVFITILIFELIFLNYEISSLKFENGIEFFSLKLNNHKHINMNPIEDLVHEHKAIKVMLSIMNKIAENIRNDQTVDTNDIESIVDFLKTFADKCHHGKEENALFPALVETGIPKEGGPIGVMLHEHAVGREYIKEISTKTEQFKSGNSEALQLIANSLLSYINLLHAHIQKEENILFPMGEKILTAQKQDEINEHFERIEEEVVGHGIHEQFHTLLNNLKSKYFG
jgi:hemerythrin-like domain-containing protein